ncbi:GntR family transcriptional regulator [Pontibacillus litoralis]|uniref:HTH gntR-type domain-containing protein n=1 Tax=Pontibacillus litoralis JSM 072002 TaxID=1385512 RepID=A0A0A5G569_9BACI|nr:GntR family transcriptional regulator [Pontibacillus litoralis]KGX88271.1 hypothetical protein N784_10735 [Pontibacillus litoralis JSM 072002]
MNQQRKQTNEEKAYEKIKRAIMLKKLIPGQKITEEWLSHELNMSRTPIRAVLKRMDKDGLLDVIPNRGAFVHNPSNKEIEDVFHVRMVLEGYAARTAIKNITTEHITEMNQLLLEEKEAYQTNDFEGFLKINGLFHTYLAKITENDVLIEKIESLNQWSDCYLILKDEFYQTPIEEVKAIAEHEAIVHHLEQGNSIQLEEAVTFHLQSTLQYLSTRPSIFD